MLASFVLFFILTPIAMSDEFSNESERDVEVQEVSIRFARALAVDFTRRTGTATATTNDERAAAELEIQGTLSNVLRMYMSCLGVSDRTYQLAGVCVCV